MTPPKCRNCGVGEWRHVCAGAVSSPAPSRVTAARKVVEEVRKTAHRAKGGVANAVANKESSRVKRWRLANRERYNARERERMRAVRAARRVSAP